VNGAVPAETLLVKATLRGASPPVGLPLAVTVGLATTEIVAVALAVAPPASVTTRAAL
jgi:hypothetical protein